MKVETKLLGSDCPTCKAPLTEQVHRPQNQMVGTFGLHIKRVICGYGCKAVSFFHLANRGLMAPRATAAISYLPMNQYELEQYNATFGMVYGYASA